MMNEAKATPTPVSGLGTAAGKWLGQPFLGKSTVTLTSWSSDMARFHPSTFRKMLILHDSTGP